jgi:hypothetical protein
MATKTLKSKRGSSVSPKEMNVKLLLEAMAIINILAGVVMIVFPVFLSGAVLGVSLNEPAAIVVLRVAGVAILSLGIVCWMVASEGRSKPGKSLVTGLAIYNTLIMMIIAYTITIQNFTSPGLWVVILLHAIFAGWCIRTAINFSIVTRNQKLF